MQEPALPNSSARDPFAERIAVVPGTVRWTAGPAPGVQRIVLDAGEGSNGRLTAFMRFAPGARCTEHAHEGGEEILVLAGTLADERGVHRAGTYLRNAPGSRHAPASPDGCTIFVKLRQFADGDVGSRLVDTRLVRWSRGRVPQTSVMPLHAFGDELTRLVHWRAGIGGAPVRHSGGAELLVLDGEFSDEHGNYGPGTWMRLPPGCWHRPRAGRRGVLAWVKTGHLRVLARDPDRSERVAEAAA
jgi:anti-sigma factor ChrR (cupin superfamily)